MTSLADLLAQPATEHAVAAASDTYAAMTPAEQQAQHEDGTKTIALMGVIVDEMRAGLPSESSRERARKAHYALVNVQARVARRIREARQHAARSRASNIVVKMMVARPRARQRSDRRGRSRSRSPDDSGDGSPGSSRRSRRRGHPDGGWLS